MMRPSFRGVTQQLKRAVFAVSLGESSWSEHLAHLTNIYPSSVKYNRASRSLTLKEFDLTLHPEAHVFFLSAYAAALALKARAGARFWIDGDGIIRCDVRGLTVRLESRCEIDVLHEIFVAGVYNVAGGNKRVVLDIGMNVGLTSLYLASDCDSVVYGYEPFKPTYDRALRNFALNPRIAERVFPNPFGIGASDQELAVPYSDEVATACSTSTPTALAAFTPQTRIEKVTVRDVRRVLTDVRALHPDLPIFVKMDCEGEEYAIFEALRGQLDTIDAWMIEWHREGPDALVRALTQAGYVSFSFNPRDALVGAIYAVRQRAPSVPR
jgi:FkbM family methyltransferase